MIEVGGVIERDGHEQRALAEGVVHRPLERRDRTRAVLFIELTAVADVDDVGALVRGVHDPAEEPAGGARPSRVVDFHGEEGDVAVDPGHDVRVARDDGRHEGAVTVEVAEREPAGIVPRDVLGDERRGVLEVHEPRQVRMQIVDAAVEDRDLDIARAEEACGPRLVREHRPNVPLPRVEPGRRGRCGRVRGHGRLARRLLCGIVRGLVVILPAYDRVGLHGPDVRTGRELSRAGLRQAGHRGHADATERSLYGAAESCHPLP